MDQDLGAAPGLDPISLRARLLDWYDAEGRALPWRVRPEERAAGARADPYAVWLSEIMLQQTTIAHAAPYWRAFLSRWPSLEALAAAPREAVLEAWAGLGYYARARNLHACAQLVVERHGGRFPKDLKALRALPGIGEYTAAAVRAAAFDLPASVVDGNVERVIARLFALETPAPKAKTEIRRLAAMLADPDRPGDYAQAIMDLGATMCTLRAPQCGRCPWRGACAALAADDPERYPIKAPKAEKPQRKGLVYCVVRNGAVWARRRPETGLLGGMWELPGSDWASRSAHARMAAASPPFAAGWRRGAPVRHVFTHFALELEVRAAHAPKGWRPPEGGWQTIDPAKAARGAVFAGLPSVMAKAVGSGLAALCD